MHEYVGEKECYCSPDPGSGSETLSAGEYLQDHWQEEAHLFIMENFDKAEVQFIYPLEGGGI